MDVVKRGLLGALSILVLAWACTNPAAVLSKTDAVADRTQVVRLNVVLEGPATAAVLAELGTFGQVKDSIPALDAVTIQGKGLTPELLLALPFVKSANYDSPRSRGPVSPLGLENFAAGVSTWNLDAVDVTEAGQSGRTVAYDGSGTYVAVLDTGLVTGWRRYFPGQRIATQYAKAFGGGGNEQGAISEPVNKWEHDTDSHGTHVTSTILGYLLGDTPVNGVAPGTTVIPVKVLNNNGSGWSSVVAQGIVYIADLKAGPLADHPVIINMSLGGPTLDAVEKAAIDYAVARGVIVVASAGNEGLAGMGYPGAYEPVISVAASGWVGEWVGGSAWWRAADVADPLDPSDFYITDFSSRALPGQDLDIAAPGSWIVGPYQKNGRQSYYFLGGTSMASPHVAGVVALLCQKKPSLAPAEAESVLESTAVPLAAGSRTIVDYTYTSFTISRDDDATGSGLLDTAAALAGI